MPVACQSEGESSLKQIHAIHKGLSEIFADELDSSQFVDVEEVGYGNGGLVFKSLHLPTRFVVARKVFFSRIPSEAQRKMLRRELNALRKCCSPFIIHYYGSVVAEFQVSLLLEFMDLGSLGDIVKKFGPIPEPLLGRIVFSVLNGLIYLHEQQQVIHRDLKPSNILINSQGEVKLCDFGDSVELINSKAQSVVGTMGYMAPERILGHPYTATSDVWSLGLTVMELATGLFPFTHHQRIIPRSPGDTELGGEAEIAIVELLEAITNEPVPELDPNHFSGEIRDFVRACLNRDPERRPTPSILMEADFVQQHKHIDLSLWTKSIMHCK